MHASSLETSFEGKLIHCLLHNHVYVLVGKIAVAAVVPSIAFLALGIVTGGCCYYFKLWQKIKCCKKPDSEFNERTPLQQCPEDSEKNNLQS